MQATFAVNVNEDAFAANANEDAFAANATEDAFTVHHWRGQSPRTKGA